MILSFFLGAVLSQVWSIANILQIITHYPLINLPMAANTIEIFGMVNVAVSFDIIPGHLQGIALKYLFYLPSDIPYNERFSTLGYS